MDSRRWVSTFHRNFICIFFQSICIIEFLLYHYNSEKEESKNSLDISFRCCFFRFMEISVAWCFSRLTQTVLKLDPEICNIQCSSLRNINFNIATGIPKCLSSIRQISYESSWTKFASCIVAMQLTNLLWRSTSL